MLKDLIWIQIHSEDQLCFPRAIVTAKAIVDDDPARKKIVKGDKEFNITQKKRATDLMTSAGIQHEGPCGMDEYTKIQECPLLTGYQIRIFDYDNMTGPIFVGKIIITAQLLL